MLGVLQTTWCPFGPFAKAYFREGPADPRVVEALICFKELFRDIRNADLK
jgi:hypothetical protein